MRYKNSDYEIFEDGSCYSYLSNKYLKPQLTNRYPTYNLTLNGKKKKVYIHRMVAETFIEKPDGKNIVNHIDGNTHNFNKDNLEWVTASENSKHALSNGLTSKGNQLINRFIENLPNEEWTELPGFPLYVISNYGRIMNYRTKRLLKPAKKPSGYLQVSLWKNNKGYTKDIHQLVYIAFTKDSNLTGYVINHIDGNKINNNITNLEKITYKENNLHAVYVIKANNCAKPVLQLDKNGNIIQEFKSIAEATRMTSISNISRAIKSKRTAGSYYWKFKE